MTDVLLINAPTDFSIMAKGTTVPLGLGYIASYLISKDVSAKMVDLEVENVSERGLDKLIEKESPLLIGVSCNTHTRYKAFEIVNHIKSKFIDIPVTMGGPHVTFTPENVLMNTSADSIVRGEGEYTTYELFESIEKNKDLKNVKGLSYKNQKNKIIHNVNRPPIEDIDSLPFPDRHSFNLKKYELSFPGEVKKELSGHMISSRGCPYKCIFCSAASFSNKKIRYRSPQSVVDEIEYLVENLMYKKVYIYDDHFTLNSKRVIEICNEIKKRNLDFDFFCYSRVDAVTQEKFKKMAQVGCKVVSFGIESGSQKVLDYLKKGVTVNQIIDAVRICNDVGIVAKGSFITGSPCESISDFKETCKLINKLYAIQPQFIVNTGFHGVFIYPGTEVYEIALENGILSKNFDWTKRYPNVTYFLNAPVYMTSGVKNLLSKAPKTYKFCRWRYLITHPNQLSRFIRKRFIKDAERKVYSIGADLRKKTKNDL